MEQADHDPRQSLWSIDQSIDRSLYLTITFVLFLKSWYTQVRRVDVPEERMGKTHGQHAAKAGGGKKGGGAVEDEEEGEEEDEGLMEDFEL